MAGLRHQWRRHCRKGQGDLLRRGGALQNHEVGGMAAVPRAALRRVQRAHAASGGGAVPCGPGFRPAGPAQRNHAAVPGLPCAFQPGRAGGQRGHRQRPRGIRQPACPRHRRGAPHQRRRQHHGAARRHQQRGRPAGAGNDVLPCGAAHRRFRAHAGLAGGRPAKHGHRRQHHGGGHQPAPGADCPRVCGNVLQAAGQVLPAPGAPIPGQGDSAAHQGPLHAVRPAQVGSGHGHRRGRGPGHGRPQPAGFRLPADFAVPAGVPHAAGAGFAGEALEHRLYLPQAGGGIRAGGAGALLRHGGGCQGG